MGRHSHGPPADFPAAAAQLVFPLLNRVLNLVDRHGGRTAARLPFLGFRQVLLEKRDRLAVRRPEASGRVRARTRVDERSDLRESGHAESRSPSR